MDGDTDVPSVQQDFAAALYQLMHQTRRKEEDNFRDPDLSTFGGHPNGMHAVTDQNKHATSNNVIKRMVNGVSNHIGNGIDAAKKINEITAQGIII